MKIDLKSGYELFSTQLETLKVMCQNAKFADFSEMGAGKTWPQCLLAKGVVDDGICDYSVIVMPKVVLGDWAAVFKNVMVCDYTKEVLVYYGLPSNMRQMVTFRPIILTTYETLCSDFNRFYELFKNHKVNFVCDEAHRLRGEYEVQKKGIKGSQRAYMCTELMHLAKRGYLLTGTPIVNGLKNAFNYIHMLRPFMFYNSRRHFQLKHMRYKDRTLIGYKDTARVENILAQLSIRFLKREVTELPPVTFTTRIIDWDSKQLEFYKQMKNDCLIELPDRFIEAVDAGPNLIRLHQIITNPQQLGLPCDSMRFAVLDDDLESIGIEEHKVVIFAHYRHTIERLREKYAHLNPAVIYGGTNDVEKEKTKFNQDSTCRIMIANPISAGVGINLSISSHAIFFEYSYDLDSYDQAVSRLDRPGQKWPVTIINYALRGSMEIKKILPRLIDKKAFSNMILRDKAEFIKFIELDEADIRERL